MKLSEIARILNANFKGEDAEFKFISTDTRTLNPGALFIALEGPRFDGNNFVELAYERGAVGALVTREIKTALPLIQVPDTKIALAHLARYRRNQVQIPIIAVTGSCGKTTTRALLTNIFSYSGKVLASEHSFNNNIGVPLTLLRLSDKHQHAIIELGANHAGEIAYLTQLVKPAVAVITNAGAAHLEGFRSIEGVAKAKGEIFQGLSSDGVAVINNDDRFSGFWRNLVKTQSVITFAINHSADIMARNIELNAKGQPKFQLISPKGKIDIQLLLIGIHNVANALAAAAAAYSKGISLPIIKVGLESVSVIKGRLLERRGYQGATIIDDSYNANPLSVSAAIDVLVKRTENSILVFGDMLELGQKSGEFHRMIGEYALKSGVKKIFCYGQLTRHTVRAFGKNAYHFDNQHELLEMLKKELDSNTILLVKGSFSMAMGKIVEALIEE